VRAMTRTLALATAAALLVIAILISLTVRHMLEPLARLTAHVAGLGGKSGADRRLAAGSPDEIGRLTEAFNTMVGELDQRLATAENERARAESVIGAIGDGINIVDREYRVLRQNDQSLRLLGDRTGDICHWAYAGQSERCLACPVARALEDGCVHRQEMVLRGPAGEFTAEITASPLRDGQGNIVAGIEVVRDITERRQLEQEVFRGRQLESLGLLAGGIAHDFNNLLTAILGNISLAQMMSQGRQNVGERLEAAERGCQRARALVQQLLTFARGGAPIRTFVSTAELVRESAEFVVHGGTVRCDFLFSPDLWNIHGDAGQISQVMHNLVLNARQAMAEGGVIRIRCENFSVTAAQELPLATGDYVRIEVADQGVGMSPEQMSKVFYPYFTTKEKGTGLGLSSVYSIVQRHGGHIRVDSVPGEGSVFQVFLPAVAAGQATAEPLPAAPVRGSGRVLVMDDEAQIRELAVAMLESLGYEAEGVEDGAGAELRYNEALAQGRPFDALILDLTVPGGMGGVEVVERLRSRGPGLRALVSSGYSQDPVMAAYADYGFSGVIAKPYTLVALATAMSRLLGARQEG